ncbi:DUF2784 domain-containing protein [Elongatibacter sediminis]|uniref:DUF2784 domain-containing protein n=1 Tax=Elongatibacter sediminis TaxID=3119006 RepID=A0AAW9RA76_9GAMM
MLSGLMADLLVVVHLAFIGFVVFGGLLVLRWSRVVWLHVPAVAWGVYVELPGSVCPLTPLEQALRARAGDATYSEGFIQHYVQPLVYPENWSVEMGYVLGLTVLVINMVVYGAVLWHRRRHGCWPFQTRMR